MSDFDYSQFEEVPEPKKKGNRTFAVLASILGAIILWAVLAGAAYAIFIMPGQQAQQAELASKASAEATATVMAATEAALVVILPTESPEPTAVILPTQVPVDTGTGGELTEEMAMTATVSALLTQAAGSNPAAPVATEAPTQLAAAGQPLATATQLKAATAIPTPTALPTTGFADEVGLPGLMGLAFLFVMIIAITRQVRATQNR